MPTGTATTFDLAVGIKLDFDEAIYMVSPVDAPLLTGLMADGLAILPVGDPATATKVEWLDEEILTPRSTLAAAMTTAEAVLTVASGHRTRFSTGDVLRVAKAAAVELLRVTGYGTTTDTLLVTRGYEGTTAVNYVTSTVVAGVGTALAEGSDPENARTADRTARYNYTQIFGPTSIKMSRTEQIVAKYGVSNEFAHQAHNRVAENVIAREQAYLYGRRTISTTTKIRTMGGLDYFITTNLNTTSTQLTETTIQSASQLAYAQGGVPDLIIANPASLGDLNALTDTGRVRVEMTSGARGRHRVMSVETEYGTVTVARDRWVFPSDAFGVNRAGLARRIMTRLIFEKLAKTGDSDHGQIVCEESFEVKGEQHMWRMNGLTY